jgi:hypothetical protein
MVNAQDEENPFEIDGIVVKPTTANGKTSSKAARKATLKAAQPKKELFARITAQHRVLLSTTRRPATAWPLFVELMMWCVKEYRKPFALPVDHLAKEIPMSRRAQLRALRDLANTGIIKIGRESRYKLPLITIPGTTKPWRKAT